MTTREPYDAIVIGAGQAGGPLSTALVQSGRKTALIERQHVGGTCINEGCTPTKTMVASAEAAYMARRAEEYGVKVGPVVMEMAVVRARKRAIVESFRSGSEKQIVEGGVDLLMGAARFTGSHALAVRMHDGSMRDLTADLIFINAGGRPTRPPLSGLDTVAYLDSTSIMELAVVPEHLLILGGGYVAAEFGQMFRRFGSEVTIVQRAAKLLTREDADIAEAVLAILREDGIRVLLNSSGESVEASRSGVRLTIGTRDGREVLSGSHLLVATGRTPNSEDLDLGAAGVNVDKAGYVVVNERLETSVPGVYALGDIKGGPAFTHISYDDFRIVRANLLDGGNRSTAGRFVPYTVFIDPQLGRVGLSEEEARTAARRVRIASMPMNQVARALEVDRPRGLMKVVIDGESDRILGAAILGLDGGELMAMVEITMMGNVPYTALRDGIFAHPTLAEAFNNLFESLRDG
ncbi:MAG TPA: mercuric reductase [Chloroflexota bacterium]|nr:mercuric reductase [Chloroflexota bacterium]